MPAISFCSLPFRNDTAEARVALRRFRRWTTSLILLCNRATVWLLAWLSPFRCRFLGRKHRVIQPDCCLYGPNWRVPAARFRDVAAASADPQRPLLGASTRCTRDPDIDVSTAIRFHPGEIAFSVLWKAGWVMLLGVAAPIIIAFEAWLRPMPRSIMAYRTTPLARRIVRLFLVTPTCTLSTTALRSRTAEQLRLALSGTVCLNLSTESKKPRSAADRLSDMQDAQPTTGFQPELPLT
jgi:hypothetical protein